MTTRLSAGATASFSPAISAAVSPSTSVCSRPTFVSSTTFVVQHVRRIEPPTEARLDDRDVDPPGGELGQRRRRDGLELRGGETLRGGPDARERLLQIGVTTVDADPLRPRPNVRRHRRADREPVGEQQRLDLAGRRRLPVRPDDVDRRIRALRVSELVQQGLHAVEPEAVRRPGRERGDPAMSAPQPRLLRPASVSRSRHCRERRARAGTARASRAPPPRREPERCRRSRRLRACPRRGAISFCSRCTSAWTSPFAWTRSGRTTAAKIRVSSSEPSSTCTPLRRKICAASWTRSRACRSAPCASSGSGHAETMRRARRFGSWDQISSVTCGMSGWSRDSSRSSAASAVAAASLSPS